MENADKLIEWAWDAFRVLIVGVVIIFAGYSIIASLLAQVPLWIQLVLGGLLATFVYAIRDKILAFLK